MDPGADRRPQRIPCAFVTAVVLFFLTDHLLWTDERWLRVLDRYATPSWRSDALATASVALLPDQTAAPAVLLLGSSQIREGLDCAAFERRFPGRACLNLAVSAGSPFDMRYLMRRVDRRVRRRVVIAGLFPRTLHGAPKESFTDLQTVRDIVAGGAWSRMSPRDWLDVLYGLLEGCSDTVRAKDGLSAAWEATQNHRAEAWALTLAPPGRRLGARLKQPPEYFERELASGRRQALRRTFVEAQEAALVKLIEGEAALRNLFVVVDFPTHPGFEDTMSAWSVTNHRAVIERLASRGDVTLVRRTDLPALAPEDWNDFTHLADTGMSQVSERLAEIVERLELR